MLNLSQIVLTLLVHNPGLTSSLGRLRRRAIPVNHSKQPFQRQSREPKANIVLSPNIYSTNGSCKFLVDFQEPNNLPLVSCPTHSAVAFPRLGQLLFLPFPATSQRQSCISSRV